MGTYYKRGHDPSGDDIRVGMIPVGMIRVGTGDDTSGDDSIRIVPFDWFPNPLAELVSSSSKSKTPYYCYFSLIIKYTITTIYNFKKGVKILYFSLFSLLRE